MASYSADHHNGGHARRSVGAVPPGGMNFDGSGANSHDSSGTSRFDKCSTATEPQAAQLIPTRRKRIPSMCDIVPGLSS